MSLYSNGRFTKQPAVIAFDYETALTDGTPSVEFYRDDFRITSGAFSWYGEGGAIESVFVEGERDVGQMLAKCVGSGLVVHNLQFEYACTKFRYPFIVDQIATDSWIDTMRLAQVYDNGGSAHDDIFIYADSDMAELDTIEGDDAKSKKKEKIKGARLGLGLAASIKRILPVQFHNHKEEAYGWLREHGVKKGREGANLNLLPHEIFARYNIADSENTLRLFTAIVDSLTRTKYSWQFDHVLHRSSVKRLIEANARGVRVDRERLLAYRPIVVGEIDKIGAEFRAHFLQAIERVEWSLAASIIDKLKTSKGKIKRWKRLKDDPMIFNVGSNLQLERLFVGELGMKPKFLTDKGGPSFKSSFLNQWGPGGLILLKRRKRLLVLKQIDALLSLSARDGRWHPQLKACATKTGRYGGGAA